MKESRKFFRKCGRKGWQLTCRVGNWSRFWSCSTNLLKGRSQITSHKKNYFFELPPSQIFQRKKNFVFGLSQILLPPRAWHNLRKSPNWSSYAADDISRPVLYAFLEHLGFLVPTSSAPNANSWSALEKSFSTPKMEVLIINSKNM